MKIARNRRRLGSPPLVLILAFVCIPMANIYFLGYVLNSSPRLAVENNSLAENLSRGDDFSVISELVMDIPTFDEMNATWKYSGKKPKKDHIVFVCWSTDLIDSIETETTIRILNLVKLFVERKHKVTVLAAGGDGNKVKYSEPWKKAVEWENLPSSKVSYVTSSTISTSHQVMEWLLSRNENANSRPIDVVYFQDTLGLGYYSLLARHQGLAFGNIKMVVLMFRPSVWTKIVSSEGLSSDLDLVIEYQEVECLRYADWVISSSKEMIANGHPFQSYAAILQQQRAHFVVGTPLISNESPSRNEHMDDPSYPSHSTQKATEIVYVGSLFHERSINLFCDTIDRILKAFPNKLKKLDCTFLIPYQQGEENSTAPAVSQNQFENSYSLNSYRYITARVDKWSSKMKSTKIEFITNASERIAYLKKENVLGVVTTVFSDLPALALELLSAEIRFVTLNREGISRILSEHGKECVLSQDNTAYSLASKIVNVLDDNTGLCKGQALLGDSLGELERNNHRWTEFHERYVSPYEQDPNPRKPNPSLKDESFAQRNVKVTVCIATYNSNVEYLKIALNSIRAQSFQNFEIVIVDDGSRDSEILSFLIQLSVDYSEYSLRVEYQENRGPGAARNKCAGVANNDILFFMDDDNVAKPTELATLISVMLRTNADVVACANDFFSGNHNPIEEPPIEHGRWIPLGPADLAGLFTNVYGDTNSLIKKSSFFTVGGFPEDYSYALEDWELLARMVSQGFKLEVVPIVQYWYRLRQGSHSRITSRQENNMRTIRPYLQTIPSKYHLLLYLAQGLAYKTQIQDVSYSALRNSANSAIENINVITMSLEALCSSGSQETQNLLTNSDFGISDKENEGIFQDWWPFGGGYTIDHFQNAHEDTPLAHSHFRKPFADIQKASSLKLSSRSNQDEYAAYQVVELNQEGPSVLLIEGWSKADHVSGTRDNGYSIYIDIHFSDGDHYWGFATNFETGSHDWESSKRLIKMEKPITSLDVYAMFRGHTGTAWFDNFSLTAIGDDLCSLGRIARETAEDIAGSVG